MCKDIICCNCGYNGIEETECPGSDDKMHCECWWDEWHDNNEINVERTKQEEYLASKGG